jgi:hypothetical protein
VSSQGLWTAPDHDIAELLGTEDDELTGAVAMRTGVAAFGQTETSGSALNSFADIWVVRTHVDGMVQFDPTSGFDTLNGSVRWHDATTHAVTTLTPTPTNPAVTVTPSNFGTTPALATPFDLA